MLKTQRLNPKTNVLETIYKFQAKVTQISENVIGANKNQTEVYGANIEYKGSIKQALIYKNSLFNKETNEQRIFVGKEYACEGRVNPENPKEVTITVMTISNAERADVDFFESNITTTNKITANLVPVISEAQKAINAENAIA